MVYLLLKMTGTPGRSERDSRKRLVAEFGTACLSLLLLLVADEMGSAVRDQR
jgi:hypothetical protein